MRHDGSIRGAASRQGTPGGSEDDANDDQDEDADDGIATDAMRLVDGKVKTEGPQAIQSAITKAAKEVLSDAEFMGQSTFFLQLADICRAWITGAPTSSSNSIAELAIRAKRMLDRLLDTARPGYCNMPHFIAFFENLALLAKAHGMTPSSEA